MYTAEELVWATQLAYCNFKQSKVDEYFINREKYPTVQELVAEENINIYYDPKVQEPAIGDTEVMRSETRDFIDAVAAGEKCKGWKIVDVCDMESVSGLYAITIQTSDDEAIIAFRGSESVNIEQKLKDWVIADFSMINGEMTAQERAAGRYLYK